MSSDIARPTREYQGMSSISARPLAGRAVERPIQQKTKGAETLTESRLQI